MAEFNWTNNTDASTLVNEYRKAADQAILVFDIAVARENQPLNAPKLMETMESLLKRDGLSDPRQLLKLLQDLSTDEHVPLIARNHALRLIKKIQKWSFKSRVTPNHENLELGRPRLLLIYKIPGQASKMSDQELLIIDVWKPMDKEVVGAPELELIQETIADRFGPPLVRRR